MAALSNDGNVVGASNQSDESQQTQQFSSPFEMTQNVWGHLFPHEGCPDSSIYDLSESMVTIGRGDSCTITLSIPQLSSHHCTIRYDEGKNLITLEDVSTNGTWVNKKKLSKQTRVITDGDEIMFVPASKKRKRKKIAYFVRTNDIKTISNEEDLTKLTLKDKYVTIKSLGQGAFAEVKLVRSRMLDPSDGPVEFAMKEIHKEQWSRMQKATMREITLLDEVKIMQSVGEHENIVSVIEYFEEPDIVYVIMDYCNGGDMLDYIQKNGCYTNEHARDIFTQMTNAMDYMHNKLSIAHRDLKPDNILLCGKNSEQIKISDFGISRKSTNSVICQTIIGTPLYQAPEVQLQREKHKNGYDGKLADIWSMGVILYIMLVAAPPAGDPQEIVTMAEAGHFLWYDEPVVELAKDLIRKMLKVNPKDRISTTDILKHPWILGWDTKEEFKTGIKKSKDENKDKDKDNDNDNNHDYDKNNDKGLDESDDDDNNDNNNMDEDDGKDNSSGSNSSSNNSNNNSENFNSYSFNGINSINSNSINNSEIDNKIEIINENSNDSIDSITSINSINSNNSNNNINRTSSKSVSAAFDEIETLQNATTTTMKNVVEDLSQELSQQMLNNSGNSISMLTNNESISMIDIKSKTKTKKEKENYDKNSSVLNNIQNDDEEEDDDILFNNKNNRNSNDSINYNEDEDVDLFFVKLKNKNPKPNKSLKRKCISPQNDENIISKNNSNFNNLFGNNDNNINKQNVNVDIDTDLLDVTQPPPKKRQRIVTAN